MQIFNQTTMWQQLNLKKHADVVKRFSCCSDQMSEWGRNVIEVTLTWNVCWCQTWWFEYL